MIFYDWFIKLILLKFEIVIFFIVSGGFKWGVFEKILLKNCGLYCFK